MVLDYYSKEEIINYENIDSLYEIDKLNENNKNDNKIKNRYKLIHIVNRVILNKRIINYINSKKLFYDNINLNSDETCDNITWECYHCSKILNNNEFCNCFEENEIEIKQEKDPPRIIENKNKDNKCLLCDEITIFDNIYCIKHKYEKSKN